MNVDRPVTPLILASSSPRRRELMEQWGYEFTVIPPHESAESGHIIGEAAPQLVARLAQEKARDVARRVSSGIVIGCDTVAECRGEILGKPTCRDDARRMLERLRGNEHRVVSGLCLWRRPDDSQLLEIDSTVLVMDALTDQQIEAYLATGAWEGKAGAFGYQDGIDWVHVIRGSESNVVGLPMEVLQAMLASLTAGQ